MPSLTVLALVEVNTILDGELRLSAALPSPPLPEDRIAGKIAGNSGSPVLRQNLEEFLPLSLLSCFPVDSERDENFASPLVSSASDLIQFPVPSARRDVVGKRFHSAPEIQSNPDRHNRSEFPLTPPLVRK